MQSTREEKPQPKLLDFNQPKRPACVKMTKGEVFLRSEVRVIGIGCVQAEPDEYLMTVIIKAIYYWFWKSPTLAEAVAKTMQVLTEHGLKVNEDLEFHSSSRIVLITSSQNLDTLRMAQRAVESALSNTADLDCQIRACSFSKRTEETVQAFERAFESAKRNAETLAAGANTQLSGVRWIRELSANAMSQRRADYDLLSDFRPESRDLFRTVCVEVSFELETSGHTGN